MTEKESKMFKITKQNNKNKQKTKKNKKLRKGGGRRPVMSMNHSKLGSIGGMGLGTSFANNVTD